MNDKRTLRNFEVKKAITSSPAWDALRSLIRERQQDDKLIDEIVLSIVDAMEKAEDFEYIKRTFQIREDLLEEMQVYCVRNGITQKTFINLAIQMMLDVSE